MAVKAKFFDKTFRDTTKERADIVTIVSRGETKDTVITIYERKNTLVIHSKNDVTNHASISKGKGQIRDWEIAYIIECILKVTEKDVSLYTRGNGIIHIRTKEECVI